MALFVAKNGSLQTIKGIFECKESKLIMSMQLQEIKNLYIKNRLTEGVDFKRYEWLVGDGSAYIDTDIIVNAATLKLEFECNNTLIKTIKSACICGSRDYVGRASSDTSIHCMDYRKYRLDIFATTGDLLYPINGTDSFRLDLSANTAVISGTTISSTKKHTNSSHTFRIFGCFLANTGYAGGLTNFKIDDGIHNLTLVPCQLLKSIPASLDANNIARSAGECGMYDSVSGKFYGNVSNTGTFTVEGDVEPENNSGLQQIYQNRLIEGVDYQTYDWLKGDAVAYINTNYLLDFDDIKTSIFRLYNTNNQIIEGSRYELPAETAGTVFGYNAGSFWGSFFSPNGSMAKWSERPSINVENTVVMSKNGITLNGTNISSLNRFPVVGSRFESVAPYLLFASWIRNQQIDSRRQKVDYKSFEISGKLHLVPCTLLHSIPRNLDAQCKERQAGECGMIDLISGKFYGNVANRGTFTVENDNNE